MGEAIDFWVYFQFISDKFADTGDNIRRFFSNRIMKGEVVGLDSGSRDGPIDGVKQLCFDEVGTECGGMEFHEPVTKRAGTLICTINIDEGGRGDRDCALFKDLLPLH